MTVTKCRATILTEENAERIGETAPITTCGLKHGTPTRPVLWSCKRAKHFRKEMSTTLQRLQERDVEWRIGERFDYCQNSDGGDK